MFANVYYICITSRLTMVPVNIQKSKEVRGRMEKIIVDNDLRKRIEKAFGVVNDTITRALNYKTNTELSKRIRAYALKNGGKTASSMMLTLHVNNDLMLQTFGDRVVIRANKHSGDVALERDGEVLTECKNATIAELMKLQERAALIALSI